MPGPRGGENPWGLCVESRRRKGRVARAGLGPDVWRRMRTSRCAHGAARTRLRWHAGEREMRTRRHLAKRKERSEASPRGERVWLMGPVGLESGFFRGARRKARGRRACFSVLASDWVVSLDWACIEKPCLFHAFGQTLYSRVHHAGEPGRACFCLMPEDGCIGRRARRIIYSGHHLLGASRCRVVQKCSAIASTYDGLYTFRACGRARMRV